MWAKTLVDCMVGELAVWWVVESVVWWVGESADG